MPTRSLARLKACSLGFAATFASLLMAGCGMGTLQSGALPSSTGQTLLSGHMLGGQQPVTGASIQLYAVSQAGYQTQSTALLATPAITQAGGSFNITRAYTCPTAPSLVYIVGSGGNPGLASNTNNTSLVLMTALGLCGNLSASTNITINEVTTIASAYALSQFMSSATNVGTSSTNYSGLANAFAMAQLLADPSSGVSPGSALPANATVEAGKINALADVISTCVNSDGTTPCTNLFNAVGISASDTLRAALAIVRNPANNVGAVYNLMPALAPFSSALTQAPADWTLSVTYTGGGLASPTALAIDSKGQPWVGNYYGVLSGFSPQGAPLFANGLTGGGMNEVYGLTIDGSDNIWVTNEETTGGVNSNKGSVTSFTNAGALRSGASGFYPGNIYFPLAAAATPSGSIWIADYGDSQSTLLASGGGALSGSGYGVNSLALPAGVAVDTDGGAWFANQGGTSVTKIGSDGTILHQVAGCCSGPTGVAIDQQGDLWITNFYGASVSEVTRAGGIVSSGYTGGGLKAPQEIAIDSNGNVWVTNFHGASVTELSGANGNTQGMPLSPATGLGLGAALSEPFGIGIDASGNLWVSNYGSSALVTLVGLAGPVKTPLTGPAQLP